MLISLKDIFHIKSSETTCGSKYPSLKPNFDSRVVELLKLNNIPFVKTTLTPFSIGSFDNRFSTKNNILHGASSSGCAIDIENKNATVGIGSDTGGSSRWPATRINAIGFKPTYDVISRYGMIPLCNRFDTVGLMSYDILALKKLFKILSEKTLLQDPIASKLKLLFYNQEDSITYSSKFNEFKEVLGETTYLEPDFKKSDVIDIYKKICYSDFYSNMCTFDKIHSNVGTGEIMAKFEDFDYYKNLELFEPIVKERILKGEEFLKKYSRKQFRALLDKITLLDSKLGNHYYLTVVANDEPERQIYYNTLEQHDDSYLLIANLTKRPSITFNFKDKFYQLIGPRNSDLTIINFVKDLIYNV